MRISSVLGLSPIACPYWMILNLILEIGIGVGAIAAWVKARLALPIWYVPEAREKLRSRSWQMMTWVPLQNHPQFHRKNWIGANRNRIFMLYLHLRRVWRGNMVRMAINLSIRDELNSSILRWLLILLLRTREGFRCWVPKAVWWIKNTCRAFFFLKKIKKIDSHFSHRSKRWLDFWAQDSIICFSFGDNPSTLTSSTSTNHIRCLCKPFLSYYLMID